MTVHWILLPDVLNVQVPMCIETFGSLDDHLTNPVYDDEAESEDERAAIAEALDDIKELEKGLKFMLFGCCVASTRSILRSEAV